MPTLTTFDDIVRFLRTNGWSFGIGETNSVSLMIEGARYTYPILIRYPWEKEIIVAYVEYPFRIPEERRAAILELTVRINRGLYFASSEYDMDSGWIGFRATMLTDGAAFNPEQFSTMLAAAISVAERYAPVFDMVISGRANAVAALKTVEGAV